MKNNNEQDRKFKNQVNHLSGFIGMPMWNGRNPTPSEIRALDRLILEEQAQGSEPKRKGFLRNYINGFVKLCSMAYQWMVRLNLRKSAGSELQEPRKEGIKYR